MKPLNRFPQVASHQLGIPIDPAQRARHDILLRPVDGLGERPPPLIHPVRPRARGRLPPRRLHHLVGHPAEQQGIGSFHLSGPVAHRLLVRREPCLVMAAAVERDVDRVSKWSHPVALPWCAPAFTGPYSDYCRRHFLSAPRSDLLNTVVMRTRPPRARGDSALWAFRFATGRPLEMGHSSWELPLPIAARAFTAALAPPRTDSRSREGVQTPPPLRTRYIVGRAMRNLEAARIAAPWKRYATRGSRGTKPYGAASREREESPHRPDVVQESCWVMVAPERYFEGLERD